MRTRYALVNRLAAKLGRRDELVAVLLESGKPFQENPACLLYLVLEDVADPNLVWVEDLWTSEEEHTAALASPELKAFVAQALPLMRGMPEQLEMVPMGGKAP